MERADQSWHRRVCSNGGRPSTATNCEAVQCRKAAAKSGETCFPRSSTTPNNAGLQLHAAAFQMRVSRASVGDAGEARCARGWQGHVTATTARLAVSHSAWCGWLHAMLHVQRGRASSDETTASAGGRRETPWWEQSRLLGSCELLGELRGSSEASRGASARRVGLRGSSKGEGRA